MQTDDKKIHFSSLIVKLPLYVAIFCALLCIINGLIGYNVFKGLFEVQYKNITQQFAYTALSYIDGDSIERYAANPVEDDMWYEADEKLNVLTKTAELAYIYVTVPDPSFDSRIYIYDTVHPDVINGKAYPLGKENSLKRYDADYIAHLKAVMLDGEPYIRFVYNDTGGHVTTSIPVKNSGGKIVAILSIVKPMSEVKSFKTSYLKATFFSSATVTIIFVLIYIFILFYRLVRPIRLITYETAYFARHKGFLTGQLTKIKGKSELGILSRSIEKMSVDMQDYMEELTKATAEKERLGAELDVAKQIQANMLPRIFPPYTNCPGIELFATMDPAKEVGGDFFDFFMVGDDHFALVVGDVSGKGVPAALFMVIAKTLIKNAGLLGLSPAEIFDRVNTQLCEGNDAGLFVTCWMGILTLSTGELRYVNAGHTPPVLCRNGKYEYTVSRPNLMLAGMEGTVYKEYKAQLNKGDKLFVYTDGVTEATNASNELYGEERLLKALQGTTELSTKDVLKAVRKDIDNFVQDAPQFDDITMLQLFKMY